MTQSYLARTDQSILGQWWWTIDRLMLTCFLLLIAAGLVLVPAASPAVARTHGIDELLFVKRHLIYLIPALTLMFGVSLLNLRNARRLSMLALLCGIICCILVLTPHLGFSTKGAQRWIHVFGFSLQPSEFLKPALAVVSAWFFARQIESRADGERFPGNLIAMLLYGICAALVISQPDLGTTILLSVIFFGQFFLLSDNCGLGLLFNYFTSS